MIVNRFNHKVQIVQSNGGPPDMCPGGMAVQCIHTYVKLDNEDWFCPSKSWKVYDELLESKTEEEFLAVIERHRGTSRM